MDAKINRQVRWYGFRWRFLLVFIIFTASLGWYIDHRKDIDSQPLQMPKNDTGAVVAKTPIDSHWPDQKHVLIGLGDSITRGYGTVKELSYFNMLIKNNDYQYPDMKNEELSHVLPRMKARNFAENCSVSAEHIKYQLLRIPQYENDVRGIVVITSGGNDLIHNYGQSEPVDGAMYGCTYEQAVIWTENVKSRIRQLLQGVNEKFPGRCEIFLANLYDPTDGVGDPQHAGLPKWKDCMEVLDLMNNKIAELCDEFDNVHLVDIHSEFIGHGIHCAESWRDFYHADDPTYWFYYNLEDPNWRGYDAIRRLFWLEITKVFTKEGN
ncbi:MAG: SGNH/GDSL hydrolase family protein [Anaerohalosphaera sp.]|nr:SGNH/GDSL hydrolase family protein [Anaerohalosphaera sp.]